MVLCRFFVVFAFAFVSHIALAFEPLPSAAPVPSNNPMSESKVELGKMLYFDKRLSKDNTVSC